MGKGKAIAGMIIGILGVVCGCLGGVTGGILSPVSFPLSIIGPVLSVKGGNQLKQANQPGGIALSALVALLLGRRRKIDARHIVGSAVYTMIGAVLGSKLLFLAVSWREIRTLDLPLIAIIKGALSSTADCSGAQSVCSAIPFCAFCSNFFEAIPSADASSASQPRSGSALP